MKKIFLIILCSFLLFSCQTENAPQESTQPPQKEVAKISKNEEQEKIWKMYCNLWRITELYSIAPDSQRYEDIKENNSDISSQKWVASKLLAEWVILDIDRQTKYFSDNTKDLYYPKTANLLINAQNGIYTTLAEMKNIETLDDFKRNFSTFLTWMEILSSVPEKSVSEWVDDILFQNAAQTKFLLCNNNAGLDFWGWKSTQNSTQSNSQVTSNLPPKPTFTESDIYIGRTTENLNIREMASQNAKILWKIPKNSFIVYTPYKMVENEWITWHVGWDPDQNIYGLISGEFIEFVWPVPKNTSNQQYKSSYSSQSFHWYGCTTDCSGHQAWYDWAEKKWIDHTDDCAGNSQSFIEWCWAYVENNY